MKLECDVVTTKTFTLTLTEADAMLFKSLCNEKTVIEEFSGVHELRRSLYWELDDLGVSG